MGFCEPLLSKSTASEMLQRGPQTTNEHAPSDLEANANSCKPTSVGASPQVLPTSNVSGSTEILEGKSVRVLICGDVCGNFSRLASHLKSVEHKQGPFDFVLCTGNFFAEGTNYIVDPAATVTTVSDAHAACEDGSSDAHPYLSGKIQFPLPVYFSDSSFSSTGSQLRCSFPDGFQFSPTLTYLGNFGFKQLSGLTIGYVSGLYNAEHFFNEDEEEEVIEVIDELELDETNSKTTSGDTNCPEDHVVTMGVTTPPSSTGSSKNDDTPAGSETLSSGKKKRYFSGLHSAYYCRSALQKMKELASRYEGKCDLFVSCQWPAGLEETLNPVDRKELEELLALGEQVSDYLRKTNTLENGSPVKTMMMTSPATSELVEYLEPRYHIASGAGVFYQRPPYKTSAHGYASKFIGLGKMQPLRELGKQLEANTKRFRFLHAFVLKPMSQLPRALILAVPSTSTSSPYFFLYNPNAPRSLKSAAPEEKRCKRFRPLDGSNENGLFSSRRVPYSSASGALAQLADPKSSAFSSKTRTIVSCLSPATGSAHTDLATDALTTSTKRRCYTSTVTSPLMSGATVGGQVETSSPTTCVFVSNIPFEVDIDNFLDIMATFGEITQATVPQNPDGKSNGRAWITYKTVDEAESAVAAHEQLQSGGRHLRIQFSHSGPPGQRNRNTRARFTGTGVGQTPEAIDVRPHSGCWFCLANPNSEKRLIVAIGEKVYVALAKGGLVPYHVLVIPVTHFPNFIFCPPDVAAELEAYVEALKRCFKSRHMDVVVYERYFPMKMTTGMHMQLQVVPIPETCSSGASQSFRRRAERAGIELTSFPSNETITALRDRIKDSVVQPYFYVELPGEDSNQIQRWIYHNPSVNPGEHLLPFNFGREAIADLLKTPHRANWKACVEPDSVELEMAQEMQSLFSPYQPCSNQ